MFYLFLINFNFSWELLGQAIVESMPTKYNSLNCKSTGKFSSNSNFATRLFLWQLFVESLSTTIFEAFCWSVSKDYTSTPLPTIYEEGNSARQCFTHMPFTDFLKTKHKNDDKRNHFIKAKASFIQKFFAKFVGIQFFINNLSLIALVIKT